MNLAELLDERTGCFKECRNALVNSLFTGLSIFLILFVTRPFGISDDDTAFLFMASAGFGGIVSAVCFFNEITVKRYLSGKSSGRWNISKELLYLAGITFVVSCFNFLYASLLLHMFDFSFRGYLEIAAYTATLLIPVTLVGILITTTTRYYKKLLVLQTKNEYLVQITRLQQSRDTAAETIKLTMENEEIPFERKGLILISALGNYLRIVVDSSPEPVEIIKRATLKDIEEQLLPYREFFRCHRSTIVNINYIKHIKGTSKRSKAVLSAAEIEVAIARNNFKSLKSMISPV